MVVPAVPFTVTVMVLPADTPGIVNTFSFASASTVKSIVPAVQPSFVAVILTDPAATPVTRPVVASTVATCGFEDE